MKTITLSIAFILCSIAGKAQSELASAPVNKYNLESQQFSAHEQLSPVYFNYSKRQLKDIYKENISPIEFLNLCRSIQDSAIQLQVARYDAFTKDKERLGVIALGGGFSAIGLLGSAGAASSSGGGQGNDVITASLACLGVVGLLAIPIAAIYSSVPHQKRKAVLFRDLPIAYNLYVESHQ